MIIRPAQAAEFARVADLHLASRAHTYSAMLPPGAFDGVDPVAHRARLRERLAAEAETHLLSVALDGPEIVGFTYVGPADEPLARELHQIHVAPSRKGTGVGKALMRAALDGFRSGGAERAYLWVIEGNDRAITFYERGGWTPEGTVREQPMGNAPTRQLRYEIDLRRG
ncbi:GNAT family N-acetyltransferase [Allocatelliglobosispora scoriae]|nr:GNAT family N-acetyltransferase [Allocatelliglobosispora scoriae]